MKKVILTAFFVLLLGFCVSAHEIPDTVRIGINSLTLQGKVTLSSDTDIFTDVDFTGDLEFADEDEYEELYEKYDEVYYIDDSIAVTVSDNGTLLCNGIDTYEDKLDFFTDDEYIYCQKLKYRGAIRLIVKYDTILIVNVISMDDYLYGVVGREMSESFPLEALKAQSVAARNYTMISMGRHGSDGFDLCNNVHCQAYGAVAAEGKKIRQAVDETSGKVLVYDDEIVQCYYYSSNGGYTENSENVWYASIGYLKGKKDPYEIANRIPNYNWTVTFTADQIRNHLLAKGIDLGQIKDIKVTKYSKNKHAMEVEIIGTKGTKEYYKDNIRAAFPSQLRSTLFTITSGNSETNVKVLTGNGMETRTVKSATVLTGDGMYEIKSQGKAGEFVFSGSGYGHGVGMSQYGAMFMAEEGYTYDEILEFYFTDTEIIDA